MTRGKVLSTTMEAELVVQWELRGQGASNRAVGGDCSSPIVRISDYVHSRP